MIATNNELTMNDSYLIVKNSENENGTIIKVSYRSNLIKVFQKIEPQVFSKIENLDVNKMVDFRKIVSIAGDSGYSLYQLTQL